MPRIRCESAGASLDDMSHWSEFDYLVINDDLEKALAEVSAIRSAEHCRVDRGGSRAAWVLKTWT